MAPGSLTGPPRRPWDPWTAARELGVAVYVVPLPSTVRGLYVALPGRPAHVLLRQGLDVVEARCVLAEELGHHAKALLCYPPEAVEHPVHHLHYSFAERRALAWATEQLLPADEFRRALSRCEGAEDLAAHFRVTVEFVQFRALMLERADRTA